MKRVKFPLREAQSFLVKYSIDNDRFGMYVKAVDASSAIWQVQQRVEGCYDLTAEVGYPEKE